MPERQTNGRITQDLDAAASRAAAGDFSELPTILRALGDEDPAVRLQAASLWGEIGSAGGVEPLSRIATSDPVPENRIEAFYALTGVGLPAAVPALITALGDNDRDCREEARVALYRLVGIEVVGLLAEEAFDAPPDPDERERVSAWWRVREHELDPARALAYGRPASPRVFIDELAATRTDVPEALYAALRDWTGEDFGDGPRAAVRRAWEAWWADHAGHYVAGTRSFHGHPVPTAPGPEAPR